MAARLLPLYFAEALLVAAFVISPVIGVELVKVKNSLNNSLSLVCRDTDMRSIVEQGVICSRDDACKGIWGLPGVATNGMECFCMEKPFMGKDLVPDMAGELMLKSSVFNKGIVLAEITMHCIT